MLGNCACFLSYSGLFLKLTFFQKDCIRNTIRVSTSLDPFQGRHSLWPDLGPNLFAKVIDRRQPSSLAGKESI